MKLVTYNDSESYMFRPVNKGAWFRPGVMITTADTSNVSGMIIAVHGTSETFSMTVLWTVPPSDRARFMDLI